MMICLGEEVTHEKELNDLKDLITNIEVENEQLRAENAALLEKFATLNKMPCNIGDTVYVLFGSCYRCEDYGGDLCSCEKRGKDKIFEMNVGSVRFDKNDYYLYEDPYWNFVGIELFGSKLWKNMVFKSGRCEKSSYEIRCTKLNKR